MRRLICLLLATALWGCSSPHGFAAYVVNQDAHGQGSGPGKSYNAEPCSLRQEADELVLRSGQAGQPGSLEVRVPFAQKQPVQVLGQTLPGATGRVWMTQDPLQLDKGSFTLQTLDGNVARGNFNLRVEKSQGSVWEVVGSFDARTP